MFRLLLIISIIHSSISYAQVDDRFFSDNNADCDGAINIYSPGEYELQFTGKSGNYQDIIAYPSLKNIPEINSLWFTFVAPYPGVFSFDAFCADELVDCIMFKRTTDDFCGDVLRGTSEIELLFQPKLKDTFGLKQKPEKNYKYPITLNEGEHLNIFFNINAKKKKKTLNLNIGYVPLSMEVAEEILSKVTDIRYDVNEPFMNIKIRDVETGLPVDASLSLTGTKSNDAHYTGSDLYYNIKRSGKVSLKIDAEGYFFMDRIEPVSSSSDHEVIIWLEPLSKGKKLEMSGIQFKMGTSEVLPGAQADLRRLKDFLSLNSNVRIEIQGHVHASQNSIAAEAVSSARARRVYKFLVDNGIDKNRLTYKGYGNTEMLYPEAKLIWEEQANRRVEIKVL